MCTILHGHAQGPATQRKMAGGCLLVLSSVEATRQRLSISLSRPINPNHEAVWKSQASSRIWRGGVHAPRTTVLDVAQALRWGATKSGRRRSSVHTKKARL
ncbi:hypothetical protein BV20DRAFT_459013 [Pilatotrama ljubarskyi]|nr:hypothetical protein BV20DRAFT_459013 [Pilatotrama ljubarskyi]